MKIEHDDLNKIIEQATIPDEWKKILRETVNSIIKRSDSVLEEIRENVLQEKNDLQFDRSKKWNIKTALVNADKFQDISGFREIPFRKEEIFLDESMDIIGNFFLDCSYEEVSKLCSDEYGDEYPFKGSVDMQGEKKSFTYRLAHDLRYVNDENLLFNVAEIYNINKPVIFSPYSRRAIKIQIPRQHIDIADFLRENIDDLTPYQLEENNLADKLKIDKRLMWNIQLESVPLPEFSTDETEDGSFFAPYGNFEIYRYEFKNRKENEFICPNNDDLKNVMTAQITSQKEEERQTITLISKNRLTSPCTSIRIIQTQDNFSVDYIFSNFDRQNKDADFSTERLRTRGDIEKVLYGLNLPECGFTCKFFGVSDTEKKDVTVIQPYNRELSYGISNNQREQLLYVDRRRLPFCYLKFMGEEKFLVDYAGYVICFLETRYPEFQWVGVK